MTYPNLHVVHATLFEQGDVAVGGLGGELTEAEDHTEDRLCYSRASAEYFLRSLWQAEQPHKVLLLSVAPPGQLGGEAGNRICGDFIDSYHPSLCVVAGTTERRGFQRIAHTLVVNPGRLADGSVAWLDWNRSKDEQVEFLRAVGLVAELAGAILVRGTLLARNGWSGWSCCRSSIRRKSQPAVCLAWLTIIFLVPFVGLAAYLLIGEIRLGARRIRRHAREVDVVAKADRPDIQLRHIVQPEIEKTQQVILHVAAELGGLPVLGGNSAELLAETDPVIDRLVQDIDRARHHVHLLFYIFAADEVGERVVAALVRARSRGVRCRLLADAVGSRKFLRTLAPKLTGQGIEVVPALPVNPVRRLFARLDLRNHRKLAVIDGRVAYTGSQNVVRPDYGKKGVGEWRDLMVRLVGPSVSQLQAVFLEDWEFETGQSIDDPEYFPAPEAQGPVALQVVPSGPNHPTRVLRDLAVEGPACRPSPGGHHHALLRPRRGPPGGPAAGGRTRRPGGPDRPRPERPAPGGPGRAVLHRRGAPAWSARAPLPARPDPCQGDDGR